MPPHHIISIIRMLNNLLLVGLLFILAQSSLYLRHLHNVSTGARCTDGSPAGLYVSEGSLKDHIVIYFLGGGYCSGDTLSEILENCYQRSATELGSSKSYPLVLDLDKNGMLSTSQAVNPEFWNWTKVVIPYCDGSFHQGSRQSPIEYKDKTLYFRGTNNTLQHFKHLNDTHKLFSASKVVVSGGSAGGIATYLWTDYIYEHSTTKGVFSVPDSGLFLTDYPNPKTGQPSLRNQLKLLLSLVNNQTSLGLMECTKYNKDPYYCFNFSNNVKYFKAPIFIIQSAYDSFSLTFILGQTCLSAGADGAYSLDKCESTNMKDIAGYRNATLTAINNFTEMESFGAWVPSCVQHGFVHQSAGWNGATYKVPGSTGSTLGAAVQKFLANPKDQKGNIHIDGVQWPQNQGCSAHTSRSNLQRFGAKIFEKLMAQ